jgi:hypothetical protein
MPSLIVSERVRTIAALASIPFTCIATLPLAAQQTPCHSICAPTVLFQPAMIRSHLFGGPLVTHLATGLTNRLPSRTSLQLQFVVTTRTAIPRTHLNLTMQWLPNASASANPFTEYTASDVGTGIRANTPSFALNASVDVVQASETGGWIGLAGYAGDLYSPAARPGDRSDYTHKLDLGALATFNLFARVPPPAWVHGVSVFAILDYVATGLPRAGDVVPKGVRRYVSSARPAALIAGLSIPIAPLSPRP